MYSMSKQLKKIRAHCDLDVSTIHKIARTIESVWNI